MLKLKANLCYVGRYHMLDKIAYDYVVAIKERDANVAKIKYRLKERVNKYSEEDKQKLRELIQKWLTKLKDSTNDKINTARDRERAKKI